VAPPFWLDGLVEAAVYFAIEMKAFALFSILFGLGLAVQFERLSRRGRPYYWLLRRLGVLLVLGLVHLCFVWNGDILTEYALTGLLVLPFLNARTSALLAACVAFLALYLCMPMLHLPIGLPDAPVLQAHVAEANRVYANGGLVAVWRFSVAELPLLLPLHLWVLPRTVALFLLGMLVWRARLFQGADAGGDHLRALSLTALVGVVGGGALIAADAQGWLLPLGPLGGALAGLAGVVLACGYGAAVIRLVAVARARRLLAPFAAVGRMAFSNYIMQSLVFGYLFFGYGLGYFGKLGAATALGLGIAVYLGQMALSLWWLGRYRHGPLEWLWRTCMYGARQPMRPVGFPE
jgi:uncharacterized protein